MAFVGARAHVSPLDWAEALLELAVCESERTPCAFLALQLMAVPSARTDVWALDGTSASSTTCVLVQKQLQQQQDNKISDLAIIAALCIVLSCQTWHFFFLVHAAFNETCGTCPWPPVAVHDLFGAVLQEVKSDLAQQLSIA